MIGIQMWKAPAGNWIVIIQESDEGSTQHHPPIGWWSHDYKTDEDAERALTAKFDGALRREAYRASR